MVYWLDFVYSPPWFYGKDIAIDIIGLIIVLLIGFFSFRNFALDKKNKRHFILGGAFVLLGLSFIAKILTNLFTHMHAWKFKPFLINILGKEIVASSGLLSAFGFFLFALLTLFGFYIIYALSSKDELSMNYVIIAYFIIVLTYFTRFTYFILYVTAFVFLLAISRRYFLSYKKNRYKNTLWLCLSFSVITLSQFVFIFTSSNPTLYVLAEIIQLIGYLFLLVTFLMVLRNAKKKK
ncbi:MAG: hypothetical protein KKF46_03610 [Nanoarchaeota archaeon]|nr:hypothetical protein [Nanoarchaeota archaeon]MBU1321422.1 hypothetical protein [Nanoarchaeota archaeon]MBU1597048.1 hypothetical protein [Nanoarchaeota archaeon]MBU2440838.1 hypothetical protein [Nanoarchaeota archaeon]